MKFKMDKNKVFAAVAGVITGMMFVRIRQINVKTDLILDTVQHIEHLVVEMQ